MALQEHIQDSIVFFPVHIDRLKEIFREIIKEEISNLQVKEETDKLLSINEVRGMFMPRISRSTVHAWTQLGILTKHPMGKSIRYLSSEVIEAAKKIKKFERRNGMWKTV